jgi:hypothetical protein
MLEAAVGMETAPIKGDSIRNVLQAIDLVLGQLDNLDSNEEVPVDLRQQIRVSGGPERVAVAYLDHLHPFIKESCARLYADSHHAHAVEESVKAVLEYLRRKTGLTLDGTPLIDRSFSLMGLS